MISQADTSNRQPEDSTPASNQAEAQVIPIGYRVDPSEKPVNRDRLLLVDDNSDVRSVVREFVKWNFPELRVLEAASAEHALRQVVGGVSDSITVVLTDHDMPGMNGLQLIEILRGKEVQGIKLASKEAEALRGIPMALMSDRTNSELGTNLRDGDVNAFVRKDETFGKNLVQTLMELIEIAKAEVAVALKA